MRFNRLSWLSLICSLMLASAFQSSSSRPILAAIGSSSRLGDLRGVLGTIGWEISNFNNSELSFLGVSSVEVSVEGKVPLERIAKKVWTQGEEDYLPAKPAKILGFEEKDIDGKSMDREKLTRFFFVRQENATTPSNDFCVTLIEPATVIIFLTSPEGLLRKAAIKKNGLWDELPKPQAEPKFHKEVEFWLKELGGAQS